MVFGTHPHVIEPVKWVKGKVGNQTLVAYSLGNFLNGQSTGNESNDFLGRIDFQLVKKPTGVHVQNVKWRSMVNHYEIAKPYNKHSKTKFKVKLLNDYTDKEIQKHGRRYIKWYEHD